MASDGDEADLQVPESAHVTPNYLMMAVVCFVIFGVLLIIAAGEWDAMKRAWEVCCAIVAIGVIVGSVGLTVWMLMQFRGY